MRFSVVTPTFNRGHLLPGLFASLLPQQADFEWVVVDDGSTDDTPRVVGELRASAPFPVSFLRLEMNRGKHVAVNRGVDAASGEMVMVFDSDDLLLPGALALFWTAWTEIPHRERHRYAGLTGRCRNEFGPIGEPLPGGVAYHDANFHDMFYRDRITEERCRVDRRDLMLRHPFPEPPGLRFLTESVVWRRIGADHLSRHLDAVVRFYRTESVDSLSRRPFGDLAAGRRPAYLATLNDDIRYWPQARVRFAKAAIQYVRSSLHTHRTPRLADLTNRGGRALAAAALPAAAALYLRDRLRN